MKSSGKKVQMRFETYLPVSKGNLFKSALYSHLRVNKMSLPHKGVIQHSTY